jgi:hypothetical protein
MTSPSRGERADGDDEEGDDDHDDDDEAEQEQEDEGVDDGDLTRWYPNWNEDRSPSVRTDEQGRFDGGGAVQREGPQATYPPLCMISPLSDPHSAWPSN